MSNILSQRLREKRKKANLKQKDIAKKLGISQSAYAYYETGRNEPDINTLIKIADLYETSVDYLIGRY